MFSLGEESDGNFEITTGGKEIKYSDYSNKKPNFKLKNSNKIKICEPVEIDKSNIKIKNKSSKITDDLKSIYDYKTINDKYLELLVKTDFNNIIFDKLLHCSKLKKYDNSIKFRVNMDGIIIEKC